MATTAAITQAARRTMGRLRPATTALLMCDLQDRFRSVYGPHLQTVVQTCRYMLSIGDTLGVPVMIATQQNKKKYGNFIQECFPTVSLRNRVHMFEKKQFSMITPEVQSLLNEQREEPLESFLIMGIETHVCVLHTCLDLIEQGKEVHVIVDGTTSQQQIDRRIALERLANSGAFLTTAQTAVFSLMQTEDHPSFNEVFKMTYEHCQLPNTFE